MFEWKLYCGSTLSTSTLSSTLSGREATSDIIVLILVNIQLYWKRNGLKKVIRNTSMITILVKSLV